MLPEALMGFARTVRATEFLPPEDDRRALPAVRERLAREADGHAARLLDPLSPLLVVLGGGTGAGKSTLLNSLAGEALSPVSVVRPTTTRPVLLLAAAGHARAASASPLPDLEHAVATSRSLPDGIAVLDTPDIDSVERQNRDVADLLLDAADVWLWCTTAQTYADDASMVYLRRAARRNTAIAVVLNRVREQDTAAVVTDLRAKLAAEGLGDLSLFVVEFHPGTTALLPAQAIARVSTWLSGIAEPAARNRLRRQTLHGAIDALEDEVAPLLAALDEDSRMVRHLQDESERAFREVWPAFEAELDRGPPLSRAVLRRWADFVGSNRLAEFLNAATGRLSGALAPLRALLASREERHLDEQVREDLADRLSQIAVSVLDLAAAATAEAWEDLPPGAYALRINPALRRAPADLSTAARAQIESWMAEVDDVIATRFAERRGRARWASGAVNAIATTGIVAVFTVSGGLTGAELGIAGAAAVTQQAVLTKVLGERNLAWLLAEIRRTLLQRVETLATGQRRRFTAAVAEIAPDPDHRERLAEAVAAVRTARALERV